MRLLYSTVDDLGYGQFSVFNPVVPGNMDTPNIRFDNFRDSVRPTLAHVHVAWSGLSAEAGGLKIESRVRHSKWTGSTNIWRMPWKVADQDSLTAGGSNNFVSGSSPADGFHSQIFSFHEWSLHPIHGDNIFVRLIVSLYTAGSATVEVELFG